MKPRGNASHHAKSTWLDREELAYNVPLWRSPRRARVLLEDGTYRTVRCGVPDTFSTIPAVAWIDGKQRLGFVHQTRGDLKNLDNLANDSWLEFVVAKPDLRSFEVAVELTSGIERDRQLRVDTIAVKAASARQAERFALQTAENTWPEYDVRIDPAVRALKIEEVENEMRTLARSIAKAGTKACYLAIMPIGEHYHVEVEVSEGTIGGVWATEEPLTPLGLKLARVVADELEQELTWAGVLVHPTREAWEAVTT